MLQNNRKSVDISDFTTENNKEYHNCPKRQEKRINENGL